MDRKSYLQMAGLVFALVSLAHLVRAVLSWPIVIAAWSVPIWLSWVAFAVAGLLGYWGFRLSQSA